MKRKTLIWVATILVALYGCLALVPVYAWIVPLTAVVFNTWSFWLIPFAAIIMFLMVLIPTSILAVLVIALFYWLSRLLKVTWYWL